MSVKKEAIILFSLLMIPVMLERLGIISGDYRQDARDALLLITAIASASAMGGVEDLKEKLKQKIEAPSPKNLME